MNLNLNLNYTEKLFVLARKAIPYSVNAAKDIMTTGGGGGSFHALFEDDCFS